jgi:transposase
LRVPDNITLMTLPPYSPELNSMENVWGYLRDNKLSNTVWDDEEAINAACKQAWDFLAGVTRRNGHRFTLSAARQSG